MRFKSMSLYPMTIPFVEAFRHKTHERMCCDSVLVRVVADDGSVGWGEGAPRPYVTGETVETMLEALTEGFWPRVAMTDLPELSSLDVVDRWLGEISTGATIAQNAARAAIECAVIDCALRSRKRSLADLLPPVCSALAYGGVISAGSVAQATSHARQMKLVGLRHIKVKVGFPDDEDRLHHIREMVGDEVVLRLDANGAWSADEAIENLRRLAPFNIAAVEQPIPRGAPEELARVRREGRIPVMVDESLVTLDDAEALIDARACDYFNLRISKCGGLARTTAIARLGERAGIALQVGCQVGETAILSAAGRHLAASIANLAFLEGSFGTLLLTEDVSHGSVNFGHGGRASLLTGPGLGINVLEESVRKYSGRTSYERITLTR